MIIRMKGRVPQFEQEGTYAKNKPRNIIVARIADGIETFGLGGGASDQLLEVFITANNLVENSDVGRGCLLRRFDEITLPVLRAFLEPQFVRKLLCGLDHFFGN